MPRTVTSPTVERPADAPWPGLAPTESAAHRQRAPRLRVLLASGETGGRRALGAALVAAGYRVADCETARDALRLCAAERPDLVLLDLETAALGGLELLRRLRLGSAVPIIALGTGDDAIAIRALDLGADDYVPHAGTPDLLLARLRAVLRRLRPAEAHARQILVAGDVTIDFARRRLFRAGREITLRPTEWQLLVELARDPGRLLPHEELLTRAWGPEYRHDRSYLRVGIRRLRHKLEDDADTPRYIHTVPGRGYLFEPAGSQ
ncbi:MAG TPA: response regulator transcription factor [Chloroflexota bacterium]|jgi:two-component system KDP operon response regulator KdpE